MSMFLVVFLIFGILSYQKLNLELIPDIDLPVVTVQTVYAGTSPDVIETQVTKKIEDAVSSISMIDRMESYSMEGVSLIMIMFEIAKNEDIANQEVKDKVDAILSELPDDADKPVIQKYDLQDRPVVDVVLAGTQNPREMYEYADLRLQDRLAQIEGVARVKLLGGQEREIRVELDSRSLMTNNISLPMVTQLLSAHSIDLPGGNFQNGTQEYGVRLKGDYESVEAIKKIEIPIGDHYRKLGEFATVTDTGKDIRERIVYFNREENKRYDGAVLMSVYKTKNGNAVKIADRMREELPYIQQELPQGMSIYLASDHSLFVKSSVRDTLTTLFLGMLFTVFVLLFFLHDIRLTIIVGLSMPFSILSAFLFMDLSGFTLNLVSMMGLSTSVGILVTNSVVVIENIYRFRSEGAERTVAASKGTSEIVTAVVASTMTNLCVFIPIATVQGLVGRFLVQFGMTIVYATIFSLLTSFTLTPMLAALILPKFQGKPSYIGRTLDNMFEQWQNFYRRVLTFVLEKKRRSLILIVLSVLLFAGSVVIGSGIGFEFLPLMDEGDIPILVELPAGSNLDESAKVLEKMERKVLEHPMVTQILVTLGELDEMNQGVHMARMDVKIVDRAERDVSHSVVAGELIEALSVIPNAIIRVAAESPVASGQEPVQFYLMGQDLDELDKYKEDVLDRIQGVEGLLNLSVSSKPGKPEVTLVPDRVKLKDAGITVTELALTLRGAVEGMVVTTYREQGEEYDVLVTMADGDVDSPEEIARLPVISQNGTFLISQLADVSYKESYSKILHKDKYKTIRFEGRNDPEIPLGDVVNNIKQRLETLDLPPGYRVDWGFQVEMLDETVADMVSTFILAFILTYMLLAAILESFIQPALILGTVPLAFIGVFAGLEMTGLSMSAVSMLAIVMLLGIVVNNAILILDYTNMLVREKGKALKEALLIAAPVKLKPILMSNIAIILGMLPMALGIGSAGRELRQPMGVVSIGGLIVSTSLSLIIIPALMYLISRRKKK